METINVSTAYKLCDFVQFSTWSLPHLFTDDVKKKTVHNLLLNLLDVCGAFRIQNICDLESEFKLFLLWNTLL